MNLSVIGGGSWGTALAAHLARSGHRTRLFVRDGELARRVLEDRENRAYLPGVALPDALMASADLDAACREAEAIFVVTPSQYCREIYARLRDAAPRPAWLVSATKGLETETLLRMSEVAAQAAPGHGLAVLSGPSFALEVAQGQPTAVVVASSDRTLAEGLQRALSTRRFRAYSSDDVVGVELAGALKNVIAIAAGIVDGLGYGANTAAALITRGLVEITRLAVARGGRADTLAGLAGLGDLVLTCTGALSRNRRVGQALGRGLSPEAATQAAPGMVAEGVRTTLAACALAELSRVEMPIARAMKAVLYEAKPVRETLDELMSRSLKRE
jgi:glycerol-3-phosphate dehydrogenase (NAD(P)+)